MILNNTFKNVGMDYCLSLLDIKTPYAREKLNSLKLFKDVEELNRQYDYIEFLICFIKNNSSHYNNILSLLEYTKEIRTSIKRAQAGAVLEVSELFEIKNFLINIREIYKIQVDNNFLEDLKLFRIKDIEDLLDIEGQNSRSFYIYDSYSEKLKKIRFEIKECKQKLNRLRQEKIRYIENKYAVKVKQNNELVISKEDKLIDEALKDQNLKKVLSTPYYVIFSIELRDEGERIEQYIQTLISGEEREEYSIRQYISERIKDRAEDFYKLTNLVGEFEILLEKASLAIKTSSVRPVIVEDTEVNILNGRHIKVEHELLKKGLKYTPISINLKKGSTVITGVNMGGKTVSLKLIGLLCMMAQMGFFVPCEELKTCLFDYYFCEAGDMQSLDTGLSTFGAEIVALNEAVKYKDLRGLVLIDEIARGTNPKEGRAILKAILSYFNKTKSIAVVTTHFDGVDDEARHYEVVGLKINSSLESISLKELNLYMDYSLREVYGKYEVPKDAIKVARLLGFDSDILDLAEKYLD